MLWQHVSRHSLGFRRRGGAFRLFDAGIQSGEEVLTASHSTRCSDSRTSVRAFSPANAERRTLRSRASRRRRSPRARCGSLSGLVQLRFGSLRVSGSVNCVQFGLEDFCTGATISTETFTRGREGRQTDVAAAKRRQWRRQRCRVESGCVAWLVIDPLRIRRAAPPDPDRTEESR